MTAIYAIADLHLSGFPPRKPMHIFGEHWLNHWDKIKSSWCRTVTEQDTVLLPGDISWALHFDEALEDLQVIAALPGRKIIIKGNHDYWWLSQAKMQRCVPESISFIHNSYVAVGDVAVCGSRGWLNPEDEYFTLQDEKIFQREKGRILASLAAARQDGFSRMILMTHYPMFYQGESCEWISRLGETYHILHYIFGHLHGKAISQAPAGLWTGIECHLVSCDALDFRVKKIMEIEVP
ncbi:hypothetical protein P22_0966 [Propionispora sp. 2/2-37]|uniref:metallophosphoesterase n=1 Tax=Propionispora sp. 2/2-37 TaxID=1677858 RepID=UPI0006C4A356|nr:metallophosphoesterase [Propionispora sp. 2/2-37]CUH94897.1 hypothetical protein P22_0966 [Propionispora sp. 2/2-37]